ncbi:hypothetical protein EJB05_48348, partial [Eragrostis curvula]
SGASRAHPEPIRPHRLESERVEHTPNLFSARTSTSSSPSSQAASHDERTPPPGLGFLLRPSQLLSGEPAAPAPADAKAEAAKMDLLEDDDEFEEFEIDQEWDDKEDGNEAAQQWEDDWTMMM